MTCKLFGCMNFFFFSLLLLFFKHIWRKMRLKMSWYIQAFHFHRLKHQSSQKQWTSFARTWIKVDSQPGDLGSLFVLKVHVNLEPKYLIPSSLLFILANAGRVSRPWACLFKNVHMCAASCAMFDSKFKCAGDCGTTWAGLFNSLAFVRMLTLAWPPYTEAQY